MACQPSLDVDRYNSELTRHRFLLAGLRFDSLKDKLTPRLLQRALAQLDKGSPAFYAEYDKAMDRIQQQPEGFRLLTHKVILWMTYARRELSLRELQEAVVIESDMTDIDPYADLVEVELLASSCAGIVIIDQRASIVRLVHYTTQEYLEVVRHKRLPSEELIASACLTRLKIAAGLPVHGSYETHVYNMRRHQPFLDYVGNTGVTICFRSPRQLQHISFRLVNGYCSMKGHRKLLLISCLAAYPSLLFEGLYHHCIFVHILVLLN